MQNLLEKLLIDTDVKIEEITKITFNEFELDKNRTLELLKQYTDVDLYDKPIVMKYVEYCISNILIFHIFLFDLLILFIYNIQ